MPNAMKARCLPALTLKIFFRGQIHLRNWLATSVNFLLRLEQFVRCNLMNLFDDSLDSMKVTQ